MQTHITWIPSAHSKPDFDVDKITILAVIEYYCQGNKQALLLWIAEEDFCGTNTLTLLNIIFTNNIQSVTYI